MIPPLPIPSPLSLERAPLPLTLPVPPGVGQKGDSNMDTERITTGVYRLGGRFLDIAPDGEVHLSRAGVEEAARRFARAANRENRPTTAEDVVKEAAREAERIRAAAERRARLDRLAVRAAGTAMRKAYEALRRYAHERTPETMEETLLFLDHAHETLGRFRPRLSEAFETESLDEDAVQYGLGREADQEHFRAWLEG